MNNDSILNVVDGRRLRSERCKQSILEACEYLIREGHLVPTAQMISDRAGVPIRTFFRHYPDMESLFHAVDESLEPRYLKNFSKPILKGSLTERIADAIDIRAKGYEHSKALYKTTKVQLWRYKALQDNYAKNVRRLSKDLESRIPELKNVDPDVQEAVNGLASYEMWIRLREQQHLSIKRSSKIIKQSINALLLPA